MMRYPSFDEHMPIGRGRWLTYYCLSPECEGRFGVQIKEHPATMIDPPWLDIDYCPMCGDSIQSEPWSEE